ncbi:DnaJ domain-containing protein [Altericista sp. CCNU0014]|uniref:DnaJ domain-containing protein n=1 Tax=Altericista sp. CCNU0014 TaxID=3082949 RepID=UPI00384DAA25
MAERLDYYAVLQVSKHATPLEIKKAFRRLARQVHPDLNPNNAAAAAQFKQLSEAYEVLGDPQRRSRYDGKELNEPVPPDETAAAAPQPKSSQAFYLRALDKLSQRDYRGAIADFTQAIALFPGGTEAYLGRCQAYDALKDDRAALEDCYQILQRNPNSAQAYLYQGNARLRLGYPQSAVEAYTKAIALEVFFAQAYYRRAQARLELKDAALAYPDLLKAIELFGAQQNWTQVQQAEILMRDLQPPTPAAVPKPSASSPPAKSYWRLALGGIPSLIFNPSDNLLPTFARLTPAPAAWTGLLYGLSAVGSLVLSRGGQQSTPLGYVRDELWKVGAIGMAAYLGLVLASAIVRRLARGRGSVAADFFLAGVAALPMAVLALGSSFQLGIGGALLRIVAVCYSVLILYVGCTQLSDIDEPRAMAAVPCTIVASLGIAALVANAL